MLQGCLELWGAQPKPGAPHLQRKDSHRISTWSRYPEATSDPHPKSSNSPRGAHTKQVPQAPPREPIPQCQEFMAGFILPISLIS